MEHAVKSTACLLPCCCPAAALLLPCCCPAAAALLLPCCCCLGSQRACMEDAASHNGVIPAGSAKAPPHSTARSVRTGALWCGKARTGN
ncbi:unnamed protein product [Lampetra fluviatilis]